ncbi:GspH/FimT family pseudopilin [Pseudomonas sp. 5Ae-yellow]|uniref:GspH/FimT family pseudopilin n=1 Tax=Pseudomonas sp. 5Ae-yellow TaxID=2759848 RepID=UPI0015F4C87E|nr:GspH/FimT family pseudopilin [Pseudomonas sp. 5Ae-yellow]MBA6418184.1 GspH/FimT family pseudopilin [Pseudomonas sp. 5Ae-yellow]
MRSVKGFTILELMITLVVAAIVLSLAVPSFQRTIANNAVRSTTSDLVSALNAARAESMSSRSLVTVLPVGGDWGNGWTIVHQSSVNSDDAYQLADKVSIRSDIASVIYRPEGGLTAAGSNITICHEDATVDGRRITLSFLGRATVEQIAGGCGA